jgi:NADH dehydrogenase
MGHVGQIELVSANVRDSASVMAAVDGAKWVINLVGILSHTRRQKFLSIHGQGAECIALAAAATGASRLIHLSSVGADVQGASEYARTKAGGEARVRAAYPGVTILRPSVIFGPEDNFFNRFAVMARLLPILPVFGRGDGPRFQPVYVGDVAEAIMAVLENPDTAKGIYELGGPEILSLRQILERVVAGTGRNRLLVHMPFWIATVMALKTAILPFPAALSITRDEILQLHGENVVDASAKGLQDLGVTPTPVAAVVPGYLARYRRLPVPGGQAIAPGPK